MKRILILNEIGSCNIGDAAIARGINDAVSTECDNVKIDNYYLQRGCFFDNYKPSHLSSQSAKTVSLPVPLFIYHFAWSARYLYRVIKDIRRIKVASMAIFGGGGLIMNNRLQFPTSMLIFSLIFRLLKIPYAISGVSLSGEIYGLSKLLFRYVFSGAFHIDIRDPISLSKFEKIFNINAKLGADYAFAISLNKKCSTKDTVDFDVLLNISSAIEQRQKYSAMIIRFLSENPSLKVLIATTGEHSDRQFATELHRAHLSTSHTIAFPDDFMEFIALARRSRFVLASRLHAGILGLLSGTKTSIIDVGYKQTGFFQGINLANNVVDASSTATIDLIEKMSSVNDTVVNDQLTIIRLRMAEIQNDKYSDC